MTTAAGSTDWELRLKDYVSAPFKKIADYATGLQTKFKGVDAGLDKIAKSSNVMGRDFKRNYSSLEQTLQGLEKRQHEAFSIKHIQAYQGMIDKTRAEMEKLNNATHPIKSHWHEMKEGLHESLNEIPGMNGVMGLATNPLALGTAAVAGSMYEGVKVAVEYEDGLAKINSTAQLSKDTLTQLRDRIEEIGTHSGGNFEKLPETYNLIYKQTHKVNESLDILEASIKGSQAGFIDLDTTGLAVAKMSDVLGDKYTNATDVMDVFFSTVKNGSGDLAEIMGELPHLTELGKGVGLSFKDTAGLMSYYTKNAGETVQQASTDMQGVFNTLRSADVIKKFKEAGVAMYDKKHHLKKFEDIIGSISDRMKKIRPDQQMQFLDNLGINDPRKAKAILMLTDHVDELKKAMDAANNSAGQMDAAFEHSENIGRDWKNIGDEIKSWGVAIGDFVLPAIDALVHGVRGFAHDLKDLITGDLFSRDARAEQEAHMDEYRKGLAHDAALKLTQQHFGDKMNFGAGSETNKFFDAAFQSFYKQISPSKNNIDKKESTAMQALKNINNGKSALGDGSKTSDLGSTTTDKNRVRNLTMNINMTNLFKAETDAGLHNAQKKIADLVTDAARDAIVTVGV